MTELFHIALRTDWEAAREAGRYEVSTRGSTLADEGFVHCSLRHQVRGVADAIYADADDLVLLTVDPARLDVPVRYEPAIPGGEAYPHVYGALPVPAVVDVRPIARGTDGRLVLPTDGE
jgi:uncharacterized protein (DUF952 family)